MGKPRRHWVGDGFHVYPVFHDLAFSQELSPWLMFDYASPEEFPPSRSRRGVGQHGHRGFETVTIAFQGEVEHGDNVGNKDVIGPGDVQWMTAGSGIIHEEYHSTNFAKTGGLFEMCQLWLNLPAKHKMTKPIYQPILHGQIPAVPLPPVGMSTTECAALADSGSGAVVKVIAGEFNGVRGPAATFSPVELWDVELGDLADAAYELKIPEGHNCVVFVRRGRALIGAEGKEKPVEAQGVALMHREGSTFRVVAAEPGTQLLILGGEPLNEPIAAGGPFVMNTKEELAQAQADYRSGRLTR